MSTGRRKQQVGRWGEQVAAASLERKGWTILEMNVRSPYGELFVEVKARTGGGYGLPEEAITPVKREHILRAIQAYWQQQAEETPWRVDVIAIQGKPGGKDVQIEHFENAITA